MAANTTALVGAGSALLSAAVTWSLGRRDQVRKDKVEPTTAVADAAADVAQTVTTLMGPLRDEVERLSAEVRRLTELNDDLANQLRLRDQVENELRTEVAKLRGEVAHLRAFLQEKGIEPPTA